MANPEHLKLLKDGVNEWNKWRAEHPTETPDLSGADLLQANLVFADLHSADLSNARLSGAVCIEAEFADAILAGAFLGEQVCWRWVTNLDTDQRAGARHELALGVNFTGADLSRADLTAARMYGVVFQDACLKGARFDEAVISETYFVNADMSQARGLEYARYYGHSTVDHRTVQRSGKLPVAFLRGCGLPDSLVKDFMSLRDQQPQFYSSFISYTTLDQAFVDRLYADLQSNGVRCWLDREDLKIGDRFRSRIDDSIRLYDKLLLILSENSIRSPWVRSEVEAAFEKERKTGRTVLVPITLDEAIWNTDEAWAADIRRTRHIGDFRRWKNHDQYQTAFARLLRDLKADAGGK